MIVKKMISFVLATLLLSFFSACSSKGDPKEFVPRDDEFEQLFGAAQDKEPSDEDGVTSGLAGAEEKTKEETAGSETTESGEPVIRVIGEDDLGGLKIGVIKKVRIKLENFSSGFRWKLDSGSVTDIKVELQEGTKHYLLVTALKEGDYQIALNAVASDAAGTIIASKVIKVHAVANPLVIENSDLGEILFGNNLSVPLSITGGSGQYLCEKAEVVGGGITANFQKEGGTCNLVVTNVTKLGLSGVRVFVGDAVLGTKIEKTLSFTVKEDLAVNFYVVNDCGVIEKLDLRAPRSIHIDEAIGVAVEGHDQGYGCAWDQETGFHHTWEDPEWTLDPAKIDLQGTGKFACLFYVPNELFAPQTPEDPADYKVVGAAVTIQGSSGSRETTTLPELTFVSGLSSGRQIRLILKSSNIAKIITEPSTTKGFEDSKEFAPPAVNVQEGSFFKAQLSVEGGSTPLDIQCLDANGSKDSACVVTTGFNLFFVADYNPRTFDVWVFNNTYGSHYLHVKDNCSLSTDNVTKIEFVIPNDGNSG